jgi:menaquinone-specific isochorismate synthase
MIHEFLTEGGIYALDQDRALIGWTSPVASPTPVEVVRFVSLPFFLTENCVEDWAPRVHTVIARSELAQRLHAYLATKSTPTNPSWIDATRIEFAAQFGSLQSLIHQKELLKGVPYGQIRMSSAVGPEWIARRLLQALKTGRSGYVYGLWDSRAGMIGCSPERLCTYAADSQILATEAVAGTMSLRDYHDGDLLRDEKAMREHSLVIDDLGERLSQLGSVTTGPTSEYRIAGLVHLRTPLQVSQPSGATSMMEMIRHLHPTAALGVYPRNTVGHDWLEECDQELPRWRFGAPFGICQSSPGGGQSSYSFLVAIRNVQWQNDDIRINAGCGVIASSRLDDEWEECLSKIESIRNLLDL